MAQTWHTQTTFDSVSDKVAFFKTFRHCAAAVAAYCSILQHIHVESILKVMSNEIWQSRSVLTLPFNEALYIDYLDDAAAIATQHSTVLQKGELNYPYLHTLIASRSERRPIKGGKSIFCNTKP